MRAQAATAAAIRAARMVAWLVPRAACVSRVLMMFPHLCRVALTLSIAVPLIVTCRGISEWQQAPAFRSELRCGLTPSQVSEIARRHGSSSFKAVGSDQHWATHALREGGTVFWFRFADGALATVQEGKYFGVTGLRLSVREELCTGGENSDCEASRDRSV